VVFHKKVRFNLCNKVQISFGLPTGGVTSVTHKHDHYHHEKGNVTTQTDFVGNKNIHLSFILVRVNTGTAYYMRQLAATLLIISGGFAAQAQTFFTSTEIGGGFGCSQYFGDLNDRYGFKTIRPAATLYVRKHITQYISMRVGAYYTNVTYSDKLNSDLFQQQRNLDFSSRIGELSAQAEFNFFKFVTGDPYHRITPYLTAGLGAFMYNPYTTLNGTRYMLRPLGTEGQFTGAYDDRKYSNVAACVPIGVGGKFWLKPGVNLTLEVSNRLTFTDYLDDVSTTYVGIDKFPLNPQQPAYLLQDRSAENDGANVLGRKGKQRGNASTKDQYLMCSFTISWHFVTYRCPSFMDHDMISTY
jgi:hypothetical protein